MEEIKGGPNQNISQTVNPARYYEASREISLAKSPDELLDRLLKKAEEFFNPEITAFLLTDLATRDLKYAKILGEKGQSLQDRLVKRGQGICGLAAETNQNLIITDCGRDPRFNPQVDHLPGLEINSLIAVPFRIEKKVFGVIALFNKKNNTSYTLDEFKLLLSLTGLAELVLEKLCLLKQIAELEEFDPLTQTYNLQSFVKYFQKEMNRCERYGINLSLLKVEIDYYEKTIQTFGQEAGDRVIANLANILKKTTRKVDLVARTGEHEFVVMLPNTGREGAQKLRLRILKILENQNLRATGIPYTVTIEIYSETGENVSTLSKIPEIIAFLSQVNKKFQRRKYPTVGEELEEAILSYLSGRQK
ncbi:MAG: diguanylate cyclase [Candidatus Saccharicenans sp.]